jgi:hypothetical protein
MRNFLERQELGVEKIRDLTPNLSLKTVLESVSSESRIKYKYTFWCRKAEDILKMKIWIRKTYSENHAVHDWNQLAYAWIERSKDPDCFLKEQPVDLPYFPVVLAKEVSCGLWRIKATVQSRPSPFTTNANKYKLS